MTVANSLRNTQLSPGGWMLFSFLDTAGGGGGLADSEMSGSTSPLTLGGQDAGMGRQWHIPMQGLNQH